MAHSLKISHLLPLALLGILLTGPALAGTCTTDSVIINSMEKSPLGDSQGIIFTGARVESTSCFGIVSGNDGSYNSPDPNIGELNDGLMNGEGNLISPTQFITPDQLLALNPDGIKNDPGWIFLGEVQGGNGTTSYTMDGYDKPLNIDNILSFKMTCTGPSDDACVTGTWSLETYLNIIKDVQRILGRNSFDHLAFVIKSSTDWAIYDFDFNELLLDLQAKNLSFDYITPYSFTGTWNTGDFLNKEPTDPKAKPQAFSHISVWVRDPLDNNEVPSPATLALVGLGLIALGLNRRKSQVS